MGNECEYCGEAVSEEYGVATCPTCGVTKCVEFCIPGGVRTECTECAEG